MRPFVKEITVIQDDLDNLKHVNNVRYLHWVQEIAEEHWKALSKNKWNNEYIWVVRKHEITYYNAAFLNDILHINTYIEKNKGPISTRIVEFKNNKTGTLLVSSSTDWCLLDKKTLRLKRIPDAISTLFE